MSDSVPIKEPESFNHVIAYLKKTVDRINELKTKIRQVPFDEEYGLYQELRQAEDFRDGLYLDLGKLCAQWYIDSQETKYKLTAEGFDSPEPVTIADVKTLIAGA